ncbi:MAG: type II toxin-antitoxin system PemK/MazF family toxin [Pseudolabrys sp.]
MKRGDVVIIAHGERGRPRPAVVVQADELGDDTSSVLVSPITSVLTERLPVRPMVETGADNGLRLRSQIMTDKTLAVPRGHIRRVFGVLGPPTVERLGSALLVVLGLAR